MKVVKNKCLITRGRKKEDKGKRRLRLQLVKLAGHGRGNIVEDAKLWLKELVRILTEYKKQVADSFKLGVEQATPVSVFPPRRHFLPSRASSTESDVLSRF